MINVQFCASVIGCWPMIFKTNMTANMKFYLISHGNMMMMIRCVLNP